MTPNHKTAGTGPAHTPAPTPEGAAATREALLTAAADVFNRDGYFGTDSNRLARAAGFAPATFYKHFTNKREVFLLTYERWVVTEWNDIRTIVDRDLSAQDSIAAVVEAVVAHHKRWRGFRRSLRALAATDDVVRAFQRKQRRTQMALVQSLQRAAGLTELDDSRSLALLLSFERICDEIADGIPRELHVRESDLIEVLQGMLAGTEASGSVPSASRRSTHRKR